MAKRKTKQQREKEAKDALLQRVADLASGACGRNMEVEDDFFVPEDLALLITAIRERLNLPKFGENNPESYIVQNPYNLRHFTDVYTLTNFLFEQGVRADGSIKQ
jgi:hypothetical protein